MNPFLRSPLLCTCILPCGSAIAFLHYGLISSKYRESCIYYIVKMCASEKLFRAEKKGVIRSIFGKRFARIGSSSGLFSKLETIMNSGRNVNSELLLYRINYNYFNRSCAARETAILGIGKASVVILVD